MENGNHSKTKWHLHASRNDNGDDERATPQITMLSQMVEPRDRERSKKAHHQKITTIIKQL